MSDDLVDFYVHTITVQTRTGSGSYGDIYADPVDLLCFVEEKLVRSPAGNEVFSETRIYAPAGAPLTDGSLVTLPSGDVATVITTAVHDSGGLLPDHVESTVK